MPAIGRTQRHRVEVGSGGMWVKWCIERRGLAHGPMALQSAACSSPMGWRGPYLVPASQLPAPPHLTSTCLRALLACLAA